MKNHIFYIFRSKLNINIRGPNIKRIIKRFKNNNIDILYITYISNDEINIQIYKSDYEKILPIKTIYELKILNSFGIIKYKNNLLNNRYVILFILIGLMILYFLTNIIFSIDVVTNDSRLEYKIRNELKLLGIEKYKFKKSYKEIQYIKKSILNNLKKEIDWMEIESIGTKYIIKYEPRIITNIEKQNIAENIVARKDARIVKLEIMSGQIVKEINSYVKKGDIIVRGNILHNEETKNIVIPKGNVYGEVWYNVIINYPYKYYESKLTGNERKVLVIQFFNRKIELLNFNKYKTKKEKEFILLKNNLFPLKVLYNHQFETIEINENHTEEELISRAIIYSTDKINKNLKEKEYIKDFKVLNKIKYDTYIKLSIFYSVIENITDYL